MNTVSNVHNDWYISYTPFCVDSGVPETAICVFVPWNCYILYGDHRAAYEGKSFLECIEYYLKNDHLIGKTSDSMPANFVRLVHSLKASEGGPTGAPKNTIACGCDKCRVGYAWKEETTTAVYRS